MTYIKENVPGKNNTGNTHMNQVVGDKRDTSRVSLPESSLMNYNKALYYHIHAPAGIYPSLAAPIQLTSNAAAWTLGDKTTIIGNIASTLSNDTTISAGTFGSASISNSEGVFIGDESIPAGTYYITIVINDTDHDLEIEFVGSNDVDDLITLLQTLLRIETGNEETVELLEGKIVITNDPNLNDGGPDSTVRIIDGDTDGLLAVLDTIDGVTTVVDEPVDGVWNKAYLPVAANSFPTGTFVRIIGTENYDGIFEVVDAIDGYIAIPVNGYTEETFAGTEVIRNSFGYPFDIHFVKISNISADGYYEIVLYAGEIDEEVEIGRVGFWRGSAQVRQDDSAIQIPVQNPGVRISAALADSTSSARTCDIKLYYHEYLDYELPILNLEEGEEEGGGGKGGIA
jgi:hypothetical protein